MAKELEFDGYWEGMAAYSCDCCGKICRIRFTCEEEAKDNKGHKKVLREKRGWIFTKVNDRWKDFCGETCRNKYIRSNTL